MKMFQILGPGCPKCRMLAQNAEQAAKEMGIEYFLEKITDINAIMRFGVMTTPALVIDDEVKIVGKVLSSEEIKKFLV